MYEWKYKIKFKIDSIEYILGSELERDCAVYKYGTKKGYQLSECTILENMPPSVFFCRFKNIIDNHVDNICVFYKSVDDVLDELTKDIENKDKIILKLNEELGQNISVNLIDIQQRERKLREDIL